MENEFKDRFYFLTTGRTPLTYTIPSKHTRRYPLMYFDKEKGYQRELRYATNMKSPFKDEQKGEATLKHIVFENGTLTVKASQPNLQRFLELHPHNGVVFQEHKPQEVAEDQFDHLELEIAAMNIAYEMDVEQAEAILRVEQGSSVSNMSSKELKRDLLLFAKRNPNTFINLSEDENVVLRNFGINAVEAKILKLSSDQKTFSWASNGRKLMTVPFDEHPYTALASWFKTDEGLEVYKSIEKKLK